MKSHSSPPPPPGPSFSNLGGNRRGAGREQQRLEDMPRAEDEQTEQRATLTMLLLEGCLEEPRRGGSSPRGTARPLQTQASQPWENTVARDGSPGLVARTEFLITMATILVAGCAEDKCVRNCLGKAALLEGWKSKAAAVLARDAATLCNLVTAWPGSKTPGLALGKAGITACLGKAQGLQNTVAYLGQLATGAGHAKAQVEWASASRSPREMALPATQNQRLP